MLDFRFKLDLGYKPFQHCGFDAEGAGCVISSALGQAAKELGVNGDLEIAVHLVDTATNPGHCVPATGGSFGWPIKWSGGVAPPTVTIYVYGGATIFDLERTARHEMYHLWEWLSGRHPEYNEDAATTFASVIGGRW